MDKLIPLVNQIQEVVSQSNIINKIQLPQIVVVGSQSCGKSSVLQAIIGRDFLPSGQGICTRRPCIIQLFHMPEGTEEWCEFSHARGQKFTDYSKVKQEIVKETNKVAGQKKQISNKPITMKIYSPDVIDLCLVDLPGIIKIAVKDMNEDAPQQIMEMIKPFVENPNCIILAVTQGNTDLANSDALKLARQVDPNGDRTIGVITKLDLVDGQIHNAVKALQGKIYPLKLGYFGLVLRSQKDHEAGMTPQQKEVLEQKYFQSIKHYQHMKQLGIPKMRIEMNLVLLEQIKKSIPQVRDNIIDMLGLKEQEYKQYGGELEDLDNDFEKNYGAMLLNLINKYTEQYQSIIRGESVGQITKEISGGARINYIFEVIFRSAISQINPFDFLSDNDIRRAIKNANALRPALFVPEGAFEILIKKQISRLYQPAHECANLVYEELRRIAMLISIPDIVRFDRLNDRISLIMEMMLTKCMKPTNDMIKNLIDIEMGYINTNHPDFQKNTQMLLPEDEEDNLEEELSNQNDDEEEQIQSEKESGFFGGIGNWFSGNNKDPNQKEKAKKKEAEDLDDKLKKLKNGKNFQESLDNMPSKPGMYQKKYHINQHYNSDQQSLYMPNKIKLKNQPSPEEMKQIKIIKRLIRAYFKVVQTKICDSIPKSIVTMLVKQSIKKSNHELISNLYRDESNYEQLFVENEMFAKERTTLKNEITSLRTSLDILNVIELKF